MASAAGPRSPPRLRKRVPAGATHERWRFVRRASGYRSRITTEKQEVALLRILVACGEKAIEAFHAADNPIDHDFVTELERVVDRSRAELAVLDAAARKDAAPH